MQLLNTNKFQEEYKNFKTQIDNIQENDQLKIELSDLLKILVLEVKKLDQQHNEMIISRRVPVGTDDIRSKILEIRKKLTKRLKDYSESLKH